MNPKNSTNSMNPTVGIIGCGNMGKVLVESVSFVVGSKNVFCFDIDNKKTCEIKKLYKINIAESNKQLVLNSDVIILAVKPQQIKDVLEEIKDYVNNKVVVSIAAGIKIKFLEKFLKEAQIVRVMPNLPIKVAAGVSALCKNKKCKNKNYEFVKRIFSNKGIAVDVKENLIDLITAISGSGPAYIFYISEIMQKVAFKLGLPKKIIPYIVNHTILGASKMLVEEKLDASKLKEAVTSKGGTTEQALNVFKRYKLKKIFYSAIKKAYKRAKQLSEIINKS